MKIYVTKYALTKGIQEMEAESVNENRSMAIVKIHGRLTQYFFNKEYHFSKEEAVEQADLMLKNRISSLEKQIAKLKKLNFKN